MTLTEVIDRTCYRVGLDETVTSYKDRARLYINDALRNIEARATWWWLFKSSTLTTADGTSSYSLASDCLTPLTFRDTTNNRILHLVSSEEIDAWDPDSSEEGDPQWVMPVGTNTSTGYLQVRIFPTPDGIYTVAYRYYATLPSLTSSNDSLDLQTGMGIGGTPLGIPPILQPALYLGASMYYQQELGDDESAAFNQVAFEGVIKGALRVNGRNQGNRRYRLRRPSDNRAGWTFQPQEGSLS